jgi:glycosyltransferase involved in cell wall biosynthesis|tara:strand:+ start:11341 stop:12786 length:1446 start_codon:yes stop_codon:yes gene_type:complete
MNKSFKHLPPSERKKILLICDDIRVHSGVATVAKEIVLHTASHFNWVQMAGSITHPEKGKRFDLSEDTNKLLEIDDSSVILYPIDGYGEPNFLRQLIKLEKPDAILLITDPRYFEYIFQMENEIRKNIPIAYLNIWDDYPTPLYNKAFYEACDLLMGISKQTVNINKLVLGDKADGKLIKYVPHGLNNKMFYPMTETELSDKQFLEFKKVMLGNNKFEFVAFFNSRNIRRKSIPDTLLSFKYFLDKLPREEAEKCAILLHTEEISEHGTDLIAIVELLFEDYPNNVFFTKGKFAVEQMNWLYNMTDVQMLLSSNEGWGLSLTEALLTGTPIIANTTGGMQDQMRFENENGDWIDFDSEFPSNHLGTYKTSGEWAFPVFPTNRSIQGSPRTPYIWDDRCSAEDVSDQLMNVYSLGNKKRKEIGNKGREWALGSEAGFTSHHQSERIVDAFTQLFETWKPRPKYEFINTNEVKNKVVPHKLLY